MEDGAAKCWKQRLTVLMYIIPIQNMRDDIEGSLDACREDMVAMQEEIRRR